MTSIVSSYSYKDLIIFSTFNDGRVYVCDFNGKILKRYQFPDENMTKNTPFFSITSESGSNVIISTYKSRYILSGSDWLNLEFTPNFFVSNINSQLGDILTIGLGLILNNTNIYIKKMKSYYPEFMDKIEGYYPEIIDQMEEYYPGFIIRYKGTTNKLFTNNKIYSIWKNYEKDSPGIMKDIDNKSVIKLPMDIDGGCFLGNSFIAFRHTTKQTILYKLSGGNVEIIETIEHPDDDNRYPYPGIISDYGNCVFTYKDRVILFFNENVFIKCVNDVGCTIVLTQDGPYGLCFDGDEAKLNKINQTT